MTPDVNVVLMDFKNNVKEMVIPGEDGNYTIAINVRHSYETQIKAYQHALKHIQEMDFTKTNVQEIEYNAHDIIQIKSDSISASKFEERIRRLREGKRKCQRATKRYEKKIKFLQEHGLDDFFGSLEHHYLYNDDM